MRIVSAVLPGILSIVLLSSCREIVPFEQRIERFEGYQLQGTVTTQNGIPLDSVFVRLFYSYALVQSKPLDTVVVNITDPTKIVEVNVYDNDGRYVHQMYFGYRPAGRLSQFFWNQRDDTGRAMPCGRYWIRTWYNDAIRKIVPYILEGSRTTLTNHDGRFSIGKKNLPVDALFDYYPDTSYAGSYRVLARVRLVFERGERQTGFSVDLEPNAITNRVFKLE